MKQKITLGPGQSQKVAFLIAPVATGSYRVTLNGLVGNFEAVGVKPVEVELVRAYMRDHDPDKTSIYVSGWVFMPPGTDFNLWGFWTDIQAGVKVRNPTNTTYTITPAMYRHFRPPGETYRWEPLDLPEIDPKITGEAPTGFPSSGKKINDEYECVPDVERLLLPDGVLEPGEEAFIYSSLFPRYPGWTNIELALMVNGYDLGRVQVWNGWTG